MPANDSTSQRRYLQDGNLDHAYATTAHSAQGATVDNAFILGSDDLYREWGVHSLHTPPRDSASFYVNLGTGQAGLPGVDRGEMTGWQEIEAALARSRAKDLAIGRGRLCLDKPERDTWDDVRGIADTSHPAPADGGLDF